MADHSPRIAVVTGAGSGIGAAVAHALAGNGWAVVLAGRRPEALASVAERGADLAGALDPVPTDVTDEASVRALFDRTVERYLEYRLDTFDHLKAALAADPDLVLAHCLKGPRALPSGLRALTAAARIVRAHARGRLPPGAKAEGRTALRPSVRWASAEVGSARSWRPRCVLTVGRRMEKLAP